MSKQRKFLCERKTGKIIDIVYMSEKEIEEMPFEYITFDSKHDVDDYTAIMELKQDLTPEITSTQTNMNLSEIKENLTEIKQETSNDTHKSTRGGKREGSGRKKGFEMSNESKTKTSQSMRGNSNARKNK